MAALASLAACSAPEPTSHWGRHFSGAIWAGAVVEQTQVPEKLLPTLGLMGVTVWASIEDRSVQTESVEGPLTEGSTQKGDSAAVALGVAASGLAIGEWIGGDDGHAFEVLLESFVVVDGVTEILKHTFPRQRPDGSGNDSFPSGHTSFAFTMATFLGRRIDDLGDGWYTGLGYLAYIPAAYVGIDRSEANRHWPSDVAVGALLGFVLSNVVYDAHYGTPRHEGISGHSSGPRWSVEPSVSEDGGSMVELVMRF